MHGYIIHGHHFNKCLHNACRMYIGTYILLKLLKMTAFSQVVELWSSCFHAAQKVYLTLFVSVCVGESLLGGCLALYLTLKSVETFQIEIISYQWPAIKKKLEKRRNAHKKKKKKEKSAQINEVPLMASLVTSHSSWITLSW